MAVAAIVGILFGFYPELDLRVTGFLFKYNSYHMRALLNPVRDVAMWIIAALVAPAAIALLLKLILPRRKLLVSARAILFLTMTLALGPGALVNLVLKEYWGRPRPVDVVEFGGKDRFVPWWDVRGECPGNCSFVSGDVSGAYWTLAPAALTVPAWRPVAYAGAIVFGAAMSVQRMILGGHFVTDTIFAGVFTFLVIWLCYAAIYRWPRTRLSDAALEAAIERLAMPGYRWITGRFGTGKSR